MKGRLNVAEVTINNVLGIRHLAIEPGKVTRIQGRNGTMKSSVLAAIQAALGGGNLAKLAHVPQLGEEAGDPEVVLVLKGEGGEYRVEKKGGDTAKVMARVGDTQAFEKMGKPQAWLDSLHDVRACNIVSLLKADDDDIARLLLEALPLEINREELVGIIGEFMRHVQAVPRGLHALEELERIRKNIYDARTGVNVHKDAAKKSAEQLRLALPAVMPATRAAEIASTRKDRDALASEIAQDEERASANERAALADAQHIEELEAERVSAAFRKKASDLRATHAQEAARIRAEAEQRIAGLRDEMEASITQEKVAGDEILATAAATLTTAQEAARTVRAGAEEALKAKREQLRGLDSRLATMTAQKEQADKAAGLAEQLEKFDQKAEELDGESRRMTATLKALDDFALRTSESLPVPGLSIHGQEVKVNGILWPQINKAQRVSILARIASIRAQGRILPFVLVDDAESLDTEHIDLMEEEFLRAGVQAITGRVTNTDLEMLADGEPATAAAR